MAIAPPQACSIKVSEDEVQRGRLTERNIELAVRALYHDGLIAIEDVFDRGVLDSLTKKMVEDALTLQARGGNSPFIYNRSNLQQDAPLSGNIST